MLTAFRFTLFNAQTAEVSDDTEKQQHDSTTRRSSVPPCSPTPVPVKTEGTESGLNEGGVGEEDSKSLLMDIVSQIAAEPGADYMKDI